MILNRFNQGSISKHRGFTLIEVLVSISLLAGLVGLAVPSFTALIEKNRIEGAMSEYAFALRTARSLAVSNSVPTYVCPSSSAGNVAPVCDANADWSDGFIIYSKPANTSSMLGFLTFDPDADRLAAQLDFPESVSSLLQIEVDNADEYIGFSNMGEIIQPSPNANPAIRICGEAGGLELGRVFRLSTVGRLSLSNVENENVSCSDEAFS